MDQEYNGQEEPIETTILDLARDALRVNGHDLDQEIQGLLEAAQADLALSGVSKDKIVDTDPLIQRALIVYAKAHFGWASNVEAERFERSYFALKSHLTLSAEYTEG